MSNPESFIDEVSDELRRDRLYATMKRYGWIAILVVILIVGGAAWREWSRAQAQAEAQAFGTAILSALEAEDAGARAAALADIEAPTPKGAALVAMMRAAEAGSSGDDADAVAALQAVSEDAEIPQIYRQIARYKALTRGAATLDVDTRRAGFEALAVAGQPLRLLAEEQLALIEIETGATDAALERLGRIAEDAEATAGLRLRASRLIVALGGTVPQAG